MAKISILGGGAWGTAVATVLAHNGHEVLIWCNEPEVACHINERHMNERFLPGILLSPLITATHNLSYAVQSHDIIFQATPIPYLRSVLQNAQPYVSSEVTWVTLSKGVEQSTLQLPTQIIRSIFGAQSRVAVVSGPNFAKDLALCMPTGTTVASDDRELAFLVARLLHCSYVKPYVCSDLIGAQIDGAMKNVITLAIGFVRGAGYTDNTAAFLLTRGLKEMAIVCSMFGGQAHSTYGLAGMGDLVLTSMGGLSRNLKMGMMLAQGMTITEIEENLGILPEGANTVESIERFRQKNGLTLPICHAMYDVIHKKLSIKDFIARIMTPEIEEE